MSQRWTAKASAFVLIAGVLPLTALIPQARQAVSGQAPATTLALVGGRVVDGFGGLPLENAVVVVQGDTIVQVAREGEVSLPPGATVLDTNGMTVLPGLWESRGHLMHLAEGTPTDFERRFETRMPEIMAAAARATLASGVTSFRDLGGPLTPLLELRAAIAAGRIAGPTLYVAGPAITQRSAGPQTSLFAVATPDEAAAAVASLVGAGVDQISVTGAWHETVLQRIVDDAHRAGRGVDAGPREIEGYRMALRAGVDRLHSVFVADPLSDYSDEDLRAVVRGAKPIATGPSANILRGPFILPALEMREAYVRALAFPEHVEAPRWRADLASDLADYLRDSWRRPEAIPWGIGARERMVVAHAKVRRFVEAGGREQLVAGTDAGSPLNFHSPIPREVLNLANAGLSAMEALQSATLRAAQLQGVDAQVGTVTVGKRADLIVVDGDPLQDLRLLQHRVSYVIKSGVVAVRAVH